MNSTQTFGRELELHSIPNPTPIVFVLDDDISVRESLELLICSQGWQAQICDSAQDFLARPRSFAPSSLILAFSSTNSNGPEIQRRIARECAEMQIIVIADYGDIPTTVRAMKAGAVDFLMKPFAAELLVVAIRRSLVRSRAVLDRCKELHDLRNCYALLSPREQQVMALVVSGLPGFGILKWPTSAVCFGPPWAKRTSSLDLSDELGSGGGGWTGEPRWSYTSRSGVSMSLAQGRLLG